MKSLVVECKLPTVPSRVDEVEAMAETVGFEVMDSIVQKRNSVHHSFCIGRGKLEDIKKIVKDQNIEQIIFTNTLPSSQIFKIKKEVGNDIKVIDRNLLILELFRKRAMTREAKLQIQLAHLKYTFSWGREFLKLRGLLGEQVGWSGPGDYPFKEYQKAARARISRISGELEKIENKKELLRSRRHELGYPIVALAGYTQSGKTTFFNRVTLESKAVGLGPFTTLSTFARKVEFAQSTDRVEFILVDSIGFIEDMHPIIVNAFNATLEEIAHADLLLIFIDVSDELDILERKVASSSQVLRRIGAGSPAILCANKIDLVNDKQLSEAIEVIQKHFIGLEIIRTSAKSGENVSKLMESVASFLKEKQKTVRLQAPMAYSSASSN